MRTETSNELARPAHAPFVHLRTHSAYSLLEGALHIPKLAALAQADSMPALALTDTNNLFGALEFSEALAKAGIQPIIGCTVAVAFADGRSPRRAPDAPAERPPRIALLAKDERGYANLMRLSLLVFERASESHVAAVGTDDLAAHAEGLIALTGGPEGPIDTLMACGQTDAARMRIEWMAQIFGDRLYVELQRVGAPNEALVEPLLIAAAYALGLPLVATNEAYFAVAEDHDAHDALLCIAEGSYVSVERRRRLTPENRFKPAAEMAALFADLPEALANTLEIAQRCAYRPPTRKPILPQYIAAAGGGAAEEATELRRQAVEGLALRLAAAGPADGFAREEYEQRLDFELGVITRMNYQGYFLIVSDFIKWTKGQGIPVGPGRGSGAGSLVAWALTITDLDPIRFGLLFERFLNPERVSMPDFDIDFCQDRRDEVIRYVANRYGADRVAQIITFGKLQARAVLRDVGRVLGMSYGQVDRLCKMVPNNPANPVTLPQAIAGEPRLREARDQDEGIARLLDIGQKLEGLYRHASTHAAGVVIADRPLLDLVPLYHDPRSTLPTTQFNMKWVEAAGLVKFDFLGLKTLTVIDVARRLIEEGGGSFDAAALPLDDPASYALMSRGDTVGVFQLEGSGMRDTLRKLKPDRFEDIIAIVALYRPGPMDNIDSFVARKHGRKQPSYPHPLLEQILSATYGVIIYQEQVMQIAQVLSGYSLAEADLLRRAMGKKIKKEMDDQRARFVSGAVERGVERGKANFIFDLVAKFAGYGFNKSHAAAYALIAYQTAYLKANHPVAFLAASMKLDLGNTDKLNLFAQEARRGGIRVAPPCINASRGDFRPEGGAIRYSLAALKGVGRHAVDAIVAEREAGGAYADLSDFATRLSARVLNRKAVETLAAAGAFDALEPQRALAFENAERLASLSGRPQDDEGMNDLFGGGGRVERRVTLKPPENPWLPMDALAREFEAVGFFLSGHPLDAYEQVLSTRNVESWVDFALRAKSGRAAGALAGTVTHRQERKSKSGNRFAFAGFSDRSGQFEAVIFSDILATSSQLLEPGKAVLILVEAEPADDNVKVRVQSIQSLDEVAASVSQNWRLYMSSTRSLPALAEQLGRASNGASGEVRLVLRLPELGRDVELIVHDKVRLGPREVQMINAIDGVTRVAAG